MIKKIALSIISLVLIHTISASEGAPELTPNKRMKQAIKQGDVDTIIELLQTNADVNTTTSAGATALFFLCDDATSRKITIENLTELMAANNKKIQDDTDLHTEFYREVYIQLNQSIINAKIVAKRQYHEALDAIDLLLSKNADPNKILFYSSGPHPERILPFLFTYINNGELRNENRLNIDKQNGNGNTPLHKAIIWNNSEDYENYDDISITLSLLKQGADPSIKNKDGKTPADLAVIPTLQKSLSPDAVRTTQMPIYKQHKKGNLHSLIRQREYDPKIRVKLLKVKPFDK